MPCHGGSDGDGMEPTTDTPRSFATILFKSGASIDLDVSQIGSERNRISGELTKVTWTYHDDAVRQIVTFDIASIDAIVFHDPTAAGD